MTTFEYRCSQHLPRHLDEVFPFFADARNLEAITPAWLQFQVLTPEPIEMRAGLLLDYRLRVHGIPFRWRTRINVWEPPFRFVDEQVRGPYRLWVHTHTFTPLDGGTWCGDHVVYAVPGGRLFDSLFVRRDVERIFAFRREKLRQLFPGTVTRSAPDSLTSATTDARSSTPPRVPDTPVPASP